MIKNLLKSAVALAAGLCLTAHAGQPVVWQAIFTNTIASQAYAASNSTPVGNVVWQYNANGTSSSTALTTNYLDTLQQTLLTAYPYVTPYSTVANTANNGTYTYQTAVSPDNITWASWSNIVLTVSGTNAQCQTFQFPATQFRYLTVTNILSTVTNSYATNSASPGGLGLKIFFKGP